eukprot:8236179-Lingulodinium_polyedra.AAC.1
MQCTTAILAQGSRAVAQGFAGCCTPPWPDGCASELTPICHLARQLGILVGYDLGFEHGWA